MDVWQVEIDGMTPAVFMWSSAAQNYIRHLIIKHKISCVKFRLTAVNDDVEILVGSHPDALRHYGWIKKKDVRVCVETAPNVVALRNS